MGYNLDTTLCQMIFTDSCNTTNLKKYIYGKRCNLSLQELDNLNSRKAVLDDEVAVSAVKKEALILYDTLREIEKKRDDLINEEKNRGTPAQERERLLNQVRVDNKLRRKALTNQFL